MKPHDVYRTPEYKSLRERYEALKREHRQLVATVLPSKTHVYRSEAYQNLKKKYEAMEAEWREARGDARRSEWEAEYSEWKTAQLEHLHELLRRYVPAGGDTDPVRMIEWHVQELLCWGRLCDFTAYRLKRFITEAEEADLKDPGGRDSIAYVPLALRIALLNSSAFCAHCRAEENLTIDHIKPVALGGDSSPENLQVLCRSCNSRKGAKFERDAEEAA